MKKIIGLLQLMRPANIVTAMADILAGVALTHYITDTNILEQGRYVPVGLLLLSTAGLYGGGVVFNDVFDASLDKKERPERPIPSGRISLHAATWLGIVLLVFGVLFALSLYWRTGSLLPCFLAIVIAIAALWYNKWGKHHHWWGPLNMGLCRGLNLLLGMSVLPLALQQYWYLAVVPVIYIAAITMISRGEVHGGSSKSLLAAAILYMIVIGSVLLFSIFRQTIIPTIFFVLLLIAMTGIPLQRAIRQPVGRMIGQAVKAGVIGLIVMNAAWAAASGSLYVALCILALLPVSILLAKLFAVT